MSFKYLNKILKYEREDDIYKAFNMSKKQQEAFTTLQRQMEEQKSVFDTQAEAFKMVPVVHTLAREPRPVSPHSIGRCRIRYWICIESSRILTVTGYEQARALVNRHHRVSYCDRAAA